MRVQVTFRINKETGAVEEFLVEDLDGVTSGEDHEAEHDRIARRVGEVIERRAAPEQVVGVPVGEDESLLLITGDQAETESPADTGRRTETEGR